MNFFSLFKRKIFYKFKNKINIDKDAVVEKNLDKLFFIYGSDKSNKFKAKQKIIKGHGFSKFYTKYLKKFRFKKINILEIGSYSGASAAAFKKYFANSKVTCLDINISNFKYSSKDIKVFGTDIKKRENVIKLISNGRKKKYYYDLIVDDGSHNLSDILFAFNYLFRFLNKGGFYVIEDFKFPNYYNYNNDIDDIFVDKMIKNLKLRKFFLSKLISRKSQRYFHNNIQSVYMHKGKLKNSDICFIKK